MKLKKTGLFLALTAILLLSGCDTAPTTANVKREIKTYAVQTNTPNPNYSVNKKGNQTSEQGQFLKINVLTHIILSTTSAQGSGDNRQPVTTQTIYNFQEELIRVAINGEIIQTIYINAPNSKENKERPSLISSYNAILLQEETMRGCQHVYGCLARQARSAIKADGLKQQIVTLSQTIETLETQLSEANTRETALKAKLETALQNANSNAELVKSLQTELAQVQESQEKLTNGLKTIEEAISSVLQPPESSTAPTDTNAELKGESL
tara:strand:+ start:158388 stop:159188 length:801 start_codon:yes stop_codon:yes gene_type:complete